MRKDVLTYAADGLTMVSQLRIGEGSGPRPGVLIFPDAFGLGEHAISRAERLAGLGYVALACDLHGDGAQIDGLEKVMPLLEPLRADPSRIRARAGGGLAALKTRAEVDPTRIAAIGYCFGGTMSFELARGGADIAAAVGFHSGLATVSPAPAGSVKAKILACIGADDPGVPPEQRAAFEDEMRKGGADWQMHLYGGVVHSFTNPAADKVGRPEFARYDATADARSWTAMINLFDELFKA
jgi:dienelactone hydrolase